VGNPESDGGPGAADMPASIEVLANIIRAEKAAGHKFVLMLGAGASLGSGVKTTAAIQAELLAEYGRDLTRGSTDARFDELWERTPKARRGVFLEPMLAPHAPSAGYGRLAELIVAGYFDFVLTFNYDDLVEKALRDRGSDDYKVIVRGETRDEEFATLVAKPKPRVKIVKLHGSLEATDHFLFAEAEVNAYPPPIRDLVRELTRRNLIVCGYAFEDFAVVDAFAGEGESVYCVNPSGAPKRLRPALQARRSRDNVFAGELGKFDRFFEELSKVLLRPANGGKRGLNPFKYLDGYGRNESEWYFGREDQGKTVLGYLGDPNVKVVTLYGKKKVGKTSFVRAGVLGRLPEETYAHVYLRCRTNSVQEIVRELARRAATDPEDLDLETALRRLAAAEEKHVVLVLDQFERLLGGDEAGAANEQELISVLNALYGWQGEGMTVVLVVREGLPFFKLLYKVTPPAESTRDEELKPLTAEEVGRVVRELAERGGISFEDAVIDDLQARYAEGDGERFTLAHVQAICYLMARRSQSDREGYQATLDEELDALDRAINENDVMGFVEDFPLRHQRMLVRNLMKLVSRQSRKKIAEFSARQAAEVLCDAPFPEPIGEETGGHDH